MIVGAFRCTCIESLILNKIYFFLFLFFLSRSQSIRRKRLDITAHAGTNKSWLDFLAGFDLTLPIAINILSQLQDIYLNNVQPEIKKEKDREKKV